MTVDTRWVSVFADVPAASFDRSAQFWAVVSGSSVGTATGAHEEFVPLVPHDGDGFLWLQRVGRDTAGWHLDLHVPDAQAAERAAVDAGARVVRTAASLVVLESPAGQPFCLYHDARSVRHRPVPASWPGSGRSLADQLCLDIPHDAYDAECEFWARLTGWTYKPGGAPEFRRLNPPRELPVQLLLQRLGPSDAGGMRAHLDMSADDPGGEVARHVGLGAHVVGEFDHWTTLHDPSGLVYCVTHRKPLAVPD